MFTAISHRTMHPKVFLKDFRNSVIEFLVAIDYDTVYCVRGHNNYCEQCQAMVFFYHHHKLIAWTVFKIWKNIITHPYVLIKKKCVTIIIWPDVYVLYHCTTCIYSGPFLHLYACVCIYFTYH